MTISNKPFLKNKKNYVIQRINLYYSTPYPLLNPFSFLGTNSKRINPIQKKAATDNTEKRKE